MPIFFATTLFTSALLLFWVQPMIARMLLPLLGGTPTVWNTCMVFFQAMLLAGYAYSHFVSRRLSLRAQAIVHFSLLLVTLAALPIALTESAVRSVPWQSNPFLWLIKTLFLLVGLPFFIVSTSGPLLQNWFSRTNHPSAKDPYFLYAASNLGSLIALLGYPLLVEPALRLQQQSGTWAGIYGVFMILFAGCALMVWRIPAVASSPAGSGVTPLPLAPLSWARRGRWILLSFVPSSLMLGVTTYLTTDIASIPLLWVIPLSLYLLTFILVFARKTFLPLAILSKLLPGVAVALIFLILTDVKNPAWLLLGLHLLFFFVAAMISHSRLAEDRPPSAQLTEFYLFLSIGGVLGGLFNALLAPVVFDTVVEYPMMMVLACLMRPAPSGVMSTVRDRWLDWLLPVGAGAATALAATFIPRFTQESHQLSMALIFGAPLVASYFFSQRSLRFALALGAVMLGAQHYTAIHGRTLHVERNFFGALRVTLDPDGKIRRFYHGTTVHGIQFIEPSRRREPLSYYHRTGPFGLAFEVYQSRPANPRVAAIGLGAGAMACYVGEGQSWTFYEIDPAVLEVARNTNFFTYLADCTNGVIEHKLGDARLRLREAPPEHYGLIICDAFSSDVPPLHLITAEAMELYLSRLAPGGLLFFNVSSRYLDFRPVLGNLAQKFHLYCVDYNEAAVSSAALKEGKYSSHWVVMARQPGHLGKLLDDDRWQAVEPDADMRLWTDDYSNILAIFEWR